MTYDRRISHELSQTYEWSQTHECHRQSHIRQSCHTYEWVMSPILMSHVTHADTHMHSGLPTKHAHTHEWVTAHMRMSHVAHTNEPCHTYEWVMSHIRMSHDTHADTHIPGDLPAKQVHTYELVTSHVQMSHVTHTNESCHTYEWVMSHIQMSHVTHTNESCHTYEWAMSHVHTSSFLATYQENKVTRMNASCDTYEWVMSHIRMSHVTRADTHIPGDLPSKQRRMPSCRRLIVVGNRTPSVPNVTRRGLMLQCVVVCCDVLQCIVMCCSEKREHLLSRTSLEEVWCCSVL